MQNSSYYRIPLYTLLSKTFSNTYICITKINLMQQTSKKSYLIRNCRNLPMFRKNLHVLLWSSNTGSCTLPTEIHKEVQNKSQVSALHRYAALVVLSKTASLFLLQFFHAPRSFCVKQDQLQCYCLLARSRSNQQRGRSFCRNHVEEFQILEWHCQRRRRANSGNASKNGAATTTHPEI